MRRNTTINVLKTAQNKAVKAIKNSKHDEASKLAVVKLSVIGDLVLNELNEIDNTDTDFTENLEIIKGMSDKECFSVLMKTTNFYMFQNKAIARTTFLQDVSNGFEFVLSKEIGKEKTPKIVLLNYISFLSLETKMDTLYAKGTRRYIGSFRNVDFDYSEYPKDKLNRFIDKALDKLIYHYLSEHNLKL